MKMYVYYTHDYMDLYPQEQLRTLEDDAKAEEFYQYWKNAPVSCSVSKPRQLTKEEVLVKMKDPYWKPYADQIQELLDTCDY